MQETSEKSVIKRLQPT